MRSSYSTLMVVMPEAPGILLAKVRESFNLDSRPRLVELDDEAKEWGVESIAEEPISSEAMLLPDGDGYRIVLNVVNGQGARLRQRFSYAHELGHLLLQKTGVQKKSNLVAKHRGGNLKNPEERLCDQIAAEILMPRNAFLEDAEALGWSLNSLQGLARIYRTSITATALRMLGLTAEPCAMGVWMPQKESSGNHWLKQSYSSNYRYGVPNSLKLPRRRLWLIGRALNSRRVETGIAPIVDRDRGTSVPIDVPAEAWAWGSTEFRKVIVYYYPEMQLTEEMVAVAKATH